MNGNHRPVPVGRRIAVFGPSGAGKSTVSRELGSRLSLPVLELDAVFHASPNWVDLEPDEFRRRITSFLDSHPEGWVMDGNYSQVRDLVLARAQAAVWLNLPFTTVYPRLAWRTISRSVAGAELWNGNRESLRQTFLSRDSMLVWGVISWRRHHRSIRETLLALPPTVTPYVLRTPGQVRYLVNNATLADASSATMSAPTTSTGG